MEPMYRPAQAAELIGISERDIRAAVASRLLEIVPIGHGTKKPRYLITQSAIEKWQKAAQRLYTSISKEEKPRRKTKATEIPYGCEMRPDGNIRLARRK